MRKKPKIVVLGGGTGTYVVLSGLKKFPVELTAIVTSFDSGGSSGRLRDEFGILPPGDVRRALLALSDLPLKKVNLRQLLEYRFENGEGLKGHSFGNLFLTALNEVTGQPDLAIAEAAKILDVRGRVLPVSLTDAVLCARLEDGTIIKGETNIDIRRVRPDLKILDVFLVEGVPQALAKTKAKLVYVCNLMTKHGETDRFSVSDFVREIKRYLGPAAVKLKTVLVAKKQKIPKKILRRYREEKAHEVEIDKEKCQELEVELIVKPLAHIGQLFRHHPDKLAKALIELL